MAIKLLLIEDVEGLGRKGNIVSVRPGYARNFLLPEQLGVVATENTLRKQERLKQEREKQAAVDLTESQALSQNIENKTVNIFVKVDHEGHMYGSVSNTDILQLIQNQLNQMVEKNSIHLKHHIKQLGIHKIEIRLKEGVTTFINVNIVPEGTVLEEPAATTA